MTKTTKTTQSTPKETKPKKVSNGLTVRMHIANELSGLLKYITPSQVHELGREKLPEGASTISVIKAKNIIAAKVDKANSAYADIIERGNKVIEESQKEVETLRKDGEPTGDKLNELWEKTVEKIQQFAISDFVQDMHGNTIMYLEVKDTIDIPLTKDELALVKLLFEEYGPTVIMREKDLIELSDSL